MICPLLMGQLSINGTIRPSIMYNTSDQEQMYLPFRIAQLRMGNTIGSFDFLVNSAEEVCGVGLDGVGCGS